MKPKTDAIPLTVISDNVSANESFHSINEVESDNDEHDKEENVKKKLGGRRSLRVNSTYISQKNRLSRYKTALSTFIPFRTEEPNHELPVDRIGCFGNLSFFWVREFLLSSHDSSLHDANHSSRKYELSVMPTYNDRADRNGIRLLGIYKDEKQTRGKHGSMLKVAWNFCKTRVIIASFFYTLSILFALVGPVVFLKLTLDSLEKESSPDESKTNATIVEMFKIVDFKFNFYARLECFYYMLAFSVCLFTSKIFASITNWLNLRTSIRLRSGVLSAIFRKSIKSSMVNMISTHQILTEDVDSYVMDLVDYLTKILGTILAMVLGLVASVVLLRGPGVWPIIASVGFFCIPILLAKISTNQLRKSMHFLSRKITVIESFCVNFKDIIVHAMSYSYIKQFYYFNSAQFSKLRSSLIFNAHICEGVTAVLLGGLYLIWCDTDIKTESGETLILVLVYVFFIKNFVSDYCHSLQAISNGQGSLEKIKNSFGIATPEVSRQRTIDTRVLISMNNCKFESNEKENFSLDVSKGAIVGITGKNIKTLLYAILGHNQCKEGIFRQRATIGFNAEEPYLCSGTIKKNILLGSDFDAQRYYSAVTSTKLNEDVLQTLGADEIPIENLDLTKQQKERITLARAIYSDRDIYLFDEPFKSAVFSSNVLQMFAHVVHQIVSSDPNKAVVICSNNGQILSICTQIYDSNEDKVYTRADFERFSLASYHEKAVHYTYENVKGCNQNAIPTYKVPSRFHVQMVPENQSHHFADESTEHLISKVMHEEGASMGIINFVFIFILTLSNAMLYISLAIGFIFVVMKSYIEPWLELVFLGSFLLSTMIEIILKIYLAKMAEVKQKKFHKQIFEKLLNTSLDFLCGLNIADILNWFSINLKFAQFEASMRILKSVILIFTSLILLFVINYWLTASVLLILIAGQLIFCKIIFRGRLKATLSHYSLIEYESRKKMFAQIINNLRARDVIQSFDRTSDFCRDFNILVEDNSTAVFLQKSVKYYVDFVVQLLLSINITIMLLLSVFIGDFSIYNYLLCVILYYLIIHYGSFLVDSYTQMIIMQSKQKLLEEEVRNISNNKQVSLLYEPSLPGENGISIDFKDITVKLCGKKVLEIHKLHIEKGSIIGITGSGSHFITSLLFKLLKPSLGVVFLGNQELSLASLDMLHSLITVVPHDLQIQNLTIAEFLNPSNLYNNKTILSKMALALPEFQVQNKLSHPVKELNRRQKQLLCLIKATLRPSKIVIFEFPDIEIQETINIFIEKDLIERTIIIIGTNHRQFETCSRIVNLELM